MFVCHLIQSKCIAVDVLGMLAVDGVQLAQSGLLREERAHEELGETVERSVQVLRINIEVVHRVLRSVARSVDVSTAIEIEIEIDRIFF